MPHRLLKTAKITMVPSTFPMTDTQRTLHFPADERWDETEVDFSDPEQVTIQQIDAHGITHTILLSNEMIANLRLHALKWTTANSPN